MANGKFPLPHWHVSVDHDRQHNHFLLRKRVSRPLQVRPSPPPPLPMLGEGRKRKFTVCRLHKTKQTTPQPLFSRTNASFTTKLPGKREPTDATRAHFARAGALFPAPIPAATQTVALSRRCHLDRRGIPFCVERHACRKNSSHHLLRHRAEQWT